MQEFKLLYLGVMVSLMLNLNFLSRFPGPMFSTREAQLSWQRKSYQLDASAANTIVEENITELISSRMSTAVDSFTSVFMLLLEYS